MCACVCVCAGVCTGMGVLSTSTISFDFVDNSCRLSFEIPLHVGTNLMYTLHILTFTGSILGSFNCPYLSKKHFLLDGGQTSWVSARTSTKNPHVKTAMESK